MASQNRGLSDRQTELLEFIMNHQREAMERANRQVDDHQDDYDYEDRIDPRQKRLIDGVTAKLQSSMRRKKNGGRRRRDRRGRSNSKSDDGLDDSTHATAAVSSLTLEYADADDATARSCSSAGSSSLGVDLSAYKAYLHGIRDGGYENYLSPNDADDEHDGGEGGENSSPGVSSHRSLKAEFDDSEMEEKKASERDLAGLAGLDGLLGPGLDQEAEARSRDGSVTSIRRSSNKAAARSRSSRDKSRDSAGSYSRRSSRSSIGSFRDEEHDRDLLAFEALAARACALASARQTPRHHDSHRMDRMLSDMDDVVYGNKDVDEELERLQRLERRRERRVTKELKKQENMDDVVNHGVYGSGDVDEEMEPYEIERQAALNRVRIGRVLDEGKRLSESWESLTELMPSHMRKARSGNKKSSPKKSTLKNEEWESEGPNDSFTEGVRRRPVDSPASPNNEEGAEGGYHPYNSRADIARHLLWLDENENNAKDIYTDDDDDSYLDLDEGALVLANKTSQIMSTFQDYLHDIEDGGSPGNLAYSPRSSLSVGNDKGRTMEVRTKTNDGCRDDEACDDRYMKRGSDGDLTAVALRASMSLGTESPLTKLMASKILASDASEKTADTLLLREWDLDDDNYDLEEGRRPNRGPNKRERYTHPALHSKRSRLSALGVVLLMAICLTVGFTLGNRNNGSNDVQMAEEATMIHGQDELAHHEIGEPAKKKGDDRGEESPMIHGQPIEEPTLVAESPRQEPTMIYEEPIHKPAEGNDQHLDLEPTSTTQEETKENGPAYHVLKPNAGEDLHPIGEQQTDDYYRSEDEDVQMVHVPIQIVEESPPAPKGSIVLDSAETDAAEYDPKWYDRSVWKGRSYIDTISFCSSQESRIPCPYEAMCPDGPGSEPVGGIREADNLSEDGIAWAPVIDAPNGWVSLSDGTVGGESSLCQRYDSLHPNPPLWGVAKHGNTYVEGEADYSPHVACCKPPTLGSLYGLDPIQSGGHDAESNDVATETEPTPTVSDMNEQEVLDKLHPVWYGRGHGYHGTTYQEASDFCKSVGDMHLCPREAYCPNGPGSAHPLFVGKKAFEGEQWAPTSGTDGTGDNTWVLVGEVNHMSWSTCMTYDQINHEEGKPQWGIDGSKPELKENVLCCQNPNNLLKEQNFARKLDPIWLDESHGWNGGSHDDAMEFCSTMGSRKLCPYTAYCPHGPGRPVIGGHTADFNSGGERWAPVHGGTNKWVQIGQAYGNSATTCMDNMSLLGGEPYWGVSDERREVKSHIMCCTF